MIQFFANHFTDYVVTSRLTTLQQMMVIQPSGNVKGKVVPVLLTEHYAMKAYWGVEI
jgi:hypothetical protein